METRYELRSPGSTPAAAGQTPMDTARAADSAPDPIREGWDRIAPDFHRVVTPFTLRMGETVIERASVARGTRFLDVAAGTGALSLPAARRGALVLATDFAPSMIECLLAAARAEGLTDLEARTMDGQALQLTADTFDISASLNGVSLFPDFARGLSEMVRVTRPGGRVVIANFAPLQHVEFLTFFLGAMRAVVPGFTGLPTDPPPLPFQAADPDALSRKLHDASLTDVSVDQETVAMKFDSGRHLWDTVTSSNPIGSALVANLSTHQREEVRCVLDAMLRERSGSAGGVLSCLVNIGIGRK